MNQKGIAPLIIVAIVAVVAVVVGVGIYAATRGGGGGGENVSYPALSATAALSGDNEIKINVASGSIASGQWAYSVSSASGSYSWVDGTETLGAPSVSLGTYAPGTWYVSLKHKVSGHTYITNTAVTISISIAEATSLQLTENSTTGGVSTAGTFWVKDIGTSNAKIRFEGTAAGVSTTLIVNGALQKIWVLANGTWYDLSSSFTTYWNEWHGHFENLRTELSTWQSGTWTSPDGTVTISNIQVNPTLDDSLFVHSA